MLTNESRIYQTGQGNASSTLSLPALGNVRRVHNDGIMMLDNHYTMKETELKAVILENRLKRLTDE